MINIPEILVANGTGAFLVLFLLLYRIRIAQTIQFDEKIYVSTHLVNPFNK